MGAQASLGRQWFGVLAGPIAWTLQMAVAYPVAQEHCRGGFANQPTAMLTAIAAGALLVIAIGAWTAWSVLAAAPSAASTDGGHTIERGKFMAQLGLMLAAFFSLVVIATAMPAWLLHACN